MEANEPSKPDRVEEFRKALLCLRLEAPPAVVNDIVERFELALEYEGDRIGDAIMDAISRIEGAPIPPHPIGAESGDVADQIAADVCWVVNSLREGCEERAERIEKLERELRS